VTHAPTLARKNELLIELEIARRDPKASKRQLAELASQAAALDSLIAMDLIDQKRHADAAINLVSAASCLVDANRRIEAKRILLKARAICGQKARGWIDESLATLPKSRLPGEVFSTASLAIFNNSQLRRPQLDAYVAATRHFSNSTEHAVIQLPVGCGKTGTMSLLPFGLSKGRVLALAPNLEIAQNLHKNFDYTETSSFLRKTRTIAGESGPTCAILDAAANVHDADASDYVVTNVQQLVARHAAKWLDRLAPDYFDMLLFDEGHHNVAESWKKIAEHFSKARIISFTATPLRADGQKIEGKHIYRFPIASAIREGFVRDIASRRLEPSELRFVYQGSERHHTLDEVMQLREETWFSKGVALSPECNRHIVNASIQCMNELREQGDAKHQIIAAACSIDHANAIRSLYAERNLNAAVIHSKQPSEEQTRIREELSNGRLDVVVQVAKLGEGADYPSLGVAAIFRPYRHLVPYVQFVGRIMRVTKQNAPGHPDNRGYVVTHVGLNVDRWWDDLRQFDEGDQKFFEELALSEREFLNPVDDKEDDVPSERRRFKPAMEVIEDIVKHFVQERFLPEDRKALVDDVLHSLQVRGIDIASLGLSREDIERQVEEGQPVTPRQPLFEAPVQPQIARQEARRRLNERVRSAAKQLLNQLHLSVPGRELPSRFPSDGAINNLAAGIILINNQVQTHLNAGKNERDMMDVDQLRSAHDQMDEIIDAVAKAVQAKLKPKEG
jgi:DNA repair protein RadD